MSVKTYNNVVQNAKKLSLEDYDSFVELFEDWFNKTITSVGIKKTSINPLWVPYLERYNYKLIEAGWFMTIENERRIDGDCFLTIKPLTFLDKKEKENK